jgi:S1-C subfamily serine protease
MVRLQSMKCGLISCVVAAASALAQSTGVRTATDAPVVISKASASPNLLRDLNSSLEAVVSKVSPAVVQIVVTGSVGKPRAHRHSANYPPARDWHRNHRRSRAATS